MTTIASVPAWQDRAIAVYHDTNTQRQEAGAARLLERKARDCAELQNYLSGFLGVAVDWPEYDEERTRALVAVDGVMFARPASRHGLVIVRPCAACGRQVDSCDIDDLYFLGYALEGDLKWHHCGEWEGDRNYTPRPSQAARPATTEERLLAALREFVQANTPEA